LVHRVPPNLTALRAAGGGEVGIQRDTKFISSDPCVCAGLQPEVVGSSPVRPATTRRIRQGILRSGGAWSCALGVLGCRDAPPARPDMEAGPPLQRATVRSPRRTEENLRLLPAAGAGSAWVRKARRPGVRHSEVISRCSIMPASWSRTSSERGRTPIATQTPHIGGARARDRARADAGATRRDGRGPVRSRR